MSKINFAPILNTEKKPMAVLVLVKRQALRDDSLRRSLSAVRDFQGLEVILASEDSSGKLDVYGNENVVRQLSGKISNWRSLPWTEATLN